MAHTFIKLDIFSAVYSAYHKRVLNSKDSPIDVPIGEAEPWIRGEYALAHDGSTVEIDDKAEAELQKRLRDVTAKFLKEQGQNASRATKAPRRSAGLVRSEQPGEHNKDVDDGSHHLGGH